MALLQSGKIYNIKVDFHKALNETPEKFLNAFINEYKSVTGITNTDYSAIKSYYDENNNEHKYINLPYINDPLVTTKGNLYLGFEFNFNYIYGAPDSSYLIARKNQNNQNTILYKYKCDRSRVLVILENDEIVDDVGEGVFGPFDMTGAEDRGDGYALMHIDTRFLNTHGFYTLNVVTFIAGDLPYGFPDESKIYFSPTTFICDMIDQVTGKHYDNIFSIHDPGSIYDLNTPNEINSKVLNAIGISFDADGVEQYENNSFYPQLYEKNDNSIVLQRLQFGRLKNNNIYLTNRFKDIKLKNLTAPQKMNDYKDGWAEDILYKNDKKFLIGVSGNGLYDNWNYGEDDYIYCQYIPVIEGDTVPEPPIKLVSWSTGTDEQITAMINGFYDGIITLGEIKSVWKLGDKRKIHLNAMPASGIIEAHRAQDIDFEIIGFEHDTLTTAVNGHTKALISLDQKDCLSDGQDGKNNSERGFMSPNNTSTGTGWKGCARRNWCNTIYINAFPQYMQNLIKAVNKLTATSSTNSSISTTSDKGFLLSEIELFGGRRYSFAGEGTHYEYFTTGTDQQGQDKWKNPEWDSTSVYWYHHSGSAYWLRSPERNTSSSRKTFTSVTSSGNYAYYSQGSNAMFAPAICL